jgi:hypothetical protein
MKAVMATTTMMILASGSLVEEEAVAAAAVRVRVRVPERRATKLTVGRTIEEGVEQVTAYTQPSM